jgi:hypothetical protein
VKIYGMWSAGLCPPLGRSGTGNYLGSVEADCAYLPMVSSHTHLGTVGRHTAVLVPGTVIPTEWSWVGDRLGIACASYTC